MACYLFYHRYYSRFQCKPALSRARDHRRGRSCSASSFVPYPILLEDLDWFETPSVQDTKSFQDWPQFSRSLLILPPAGEDGRGERRRELPPSWRQRHRRHFPSNRRFGRDDSDNSAERRGKASHGARGIQRGMECWRR